MVSATNGAGASGDSNEVAATPKTPSDLVVASFSVPQKGGAGLPLTLSVGVRNQGPGAAAPTSTRFYVTTSGTLGPGAIALEGAYNVPALASGATSTGPVTAGVPSSVTPGYYFVFVKVDADGVETETSESNNTYLGGLVTIGPDLSITSFGAPSATEAGAAILVTDAVINLGGGGTAASMTRFYLSTNSSLDAGDILLPGGRTVPALAPGGSSTGSVIVTIPSTTQTGSYYLIAKTDGDNTQPETSEANNTASRVLLIGGDLDRLGADSAVRSGARRDDSDRRDDNQPALRRHRGVDDSDLSVGQRGPRRVGPVAHQSSGSGARGWYIERLCRPAWICRRRAVSACTT